MIIYRSTVDPTKTIGISQLKKAYPNISFPKSVTNEQLQFLNLPYTAEEYIPPEPAAPTLDQLKRQKASDIQRRSNDLMQVISEGYTDGEIKTFEQQNLGALDIIEGVLDTENAQFVIALLKVRLGKEEPTLAEIEEFAHRIRNNYIRASAYTSLVVGTQQHLELLVREATTSEEVEAIEANFEAPTSAPETPSEEPEEEEPEAETDPEDETE